MLDAAATHPKEACHDRASMLPAEHCQVMLVRQPCQSGNHGSMHTCHHEPVYVGHLRTQAHDDLACVGGVLFSMDVANVTLFQEPVPPVLLGQADAFTDAVGSANFTSLILSAAPGAYMLLVSVPGALQVTTLAASSHKHNNHAFCMSNHFVLCCSSHARQTKSPFYNSS